MKKSAFTLVELLIVIIIIGILATMAVLQYQKMVDKAKLAEAKIGLKALSDALLMYYIERGYWPGAENPIVNFQYDAPNSQYWDYWTSNGGREAVCTTKDGKKYLGYVGALIRHNNDGTVKKYMVKYNGSWGSELDSWPF